jgi:ubiquinone/menaquinone biosynthesis C-methylase UbiE
MSISFERLSRIWNVLITDKYLKLKNRRNLKEKENFVLDLPSHTIEHNQEMWNNYDWSQGGEEWSDESSMGQKWKQTVINEIMLKHIKNKSVILEIGPGAGRWTEQLQSLASKLILVDIAQTCLNICKDRFKTKNNIEFHLIKNNLDFIGNDSVDYVWSYDVFVHINPSDIEHYMQDFHRILKSGGCAIIHHSGVYANEKEARSGFRAHMTDKLFAHLITKHEMKLIEQNTSLVHKKGDIISIFTKP